jgi:hypothetical protein
LPDLRHGLWIGLCDGSVRRSAGSASAAVGRDSQADAEAEQAVGQRRSGGSGADHCGRTAAAAHADVGPGQIGLLIVSLARFLAASSWPGFDPSEPGRFDSWGSETCPIRARNRVQNGPKSGQSGSKIGQNRSKPGQFCTLCALFWQLGTAK